MIITVSVARELGSLIVVMVLTIVIKRFFRAEHNVTVAAEVT